MYTYVHVFVCFFQYQWMEMAFFLISLNSLWKHMHQLRVNHERLKEADPSGRCCILFPLFITQLESVSLQVCTCIVYGTRLFLVVTELVYVQYM